MRILGILALAFVLAGGAADATPLSLVLSESSVSNGDVGTLDIWVNTITGTYDLHTDDQIGFDFSVTLPAGLEITAGEWVITNFNQGEGSVTEPLDGTTLVTGDATIPLIDVPYLTSGALDVSAEIGAHQTGCTTGAPPVCTYTGFAVELEYTVQAVPTGAPEPTSIALLLSGLFGLRMIRRRM